MNIFNWRNFCCAFSIGLIMVVSLYAQKSNCKKDKKTGVINCEISATDPYQLKDVRIPNNAKVAIRVINKSPFDDCSKGDTKISPIAESDPLKTVLALFTQTMTGAKLAGSPSTNTAISNSLAGLLFNSSKELIRDVKDFNNFTKDFIKHSDIHLNQEDIFKHVQYILAHPPRNDDDFRKYPTPDTVNGLLVLTEIKNIDQKGKDAVDDNTDPDYVFYKTREDILKETYFDLTSRFKLISDQVKFVHDPLANDIILNLNFISGELEDSKSNYEKIVATRALFKTVHDILENANKKKFDAYVQEFQNLRFTQSETSTIVTCQNVISKKPTEYQIPVVLQYKNDNKLSVSVGPLISNNKKQKLGTTPTSTGLNSSGAPTFVSNFAVVDKAKRQVVPFIFVNYRLWQFGNHGDLSEQPKYSVHFSIGFGANPNSGTVEPEFFIGSSFGYKNLIFSVGDHFGRFQKGFTGGFNIGDVVPASFPSALPFKKVYRQGLGVGISYKLP